MVLNHIVAATDLSSPARHAAERAALVAAERAASLSIVHVADLAPLAQVRKLLVGDPERFEAQLVEQLQVRLKALGDGVQQRFGVAPSLQVGCGELLPGLIGFMSSNPADLMVLGARGDSNLRHMMLGSTAERLLGSSTCPMLVVKQVVHESYRHALVAVDFSQGAQSALLLARAVAASADVTVLHVFDVPFEGQLRYAGVDDEKITHYRLQAKRQAEERLKSLVESAGLDASSVRLLVLQGDASQRILEQEQNLDCDLIVVGKHGEDMFEELIMGSVTKHILAEAQGDVLVSI